MLIFQLKVEFFKFAERILKLADVPGFEPRITESKSVVLPLHYTPIIYCVRTLDRQRVSIFLAHAILKYTTSFPLLELPMHDPVM